MFNKNIKLKLNRNTFRIIILINIRKKWGWKKEDKGLNYKYLQIYKMEYVGPF